jgi:sec-independent protein translocase protein TatA
MSFGNLGFTEILLILIAVLLLFGARRIPEIMGSMGKGIKEFKRSLSDVDRQIREPEPQFKSDRLPEGEARPRTTEEEARPEPKRLLS